MSLKELLFHLINKYPHLKSRFAGSALNGKIEAARLPFYNRQCQIAGDNFLLLGDAARLIDPFTGEGIGNAMLSGVIAAENATECIASSDFSENSTKNYQDIIYRKLGQELELSLRLQRLAKSRRLLNLVIGKASGNEKLRQAISEMLYNDKAKNKLKNPLFYLKLLTGS
jgi:flavin-dependent dehydrogenase